MLKKTISYTDFNDVARTEDFYFNLTKAELMDMEVGDHESGSLYDELMNIITAQNNRQIIRVFKKIIKAAYGIKSEDGRRFTKNNEIWEDFANSNAYSELFLELGGNADAAANFINGLVPKDLSEQVSKMGITKETTPADIRRMSEERMQGFQKKSAPEVKTVTEAPAPAVDVATPAPSAVEESKPLDINGMSPEEKAELLRKLQG